jgi:IS605 OrfB family transposase
VVEFPRPALKTRGQLLGVDVGMAKLLSTSRGEFIGTDFNAVSAKIRRRKPGSKARARARRERDQLVNRSLNELPWDETRVVAYEDLAGIKKGKRKKQTKAFRRMRNPWVARLVNERLETKAQEHGVLAVGVNPAWNSQTCHACGDLSPDKKPRKGAVFTCAKCGFVGDADSNAAKNIAKKAALALPKIVKAIAAKTHSVPTSGPKGSEKVRDHTGLQPNSRSTGRAGQDVRSSRTQSRSNGRRTTLGSPGGSVSPPPPPTRRIKGGGRDRTSEELRRMGSLKRGG